MSENERRRGSGSGRKGDGRTEKIRAKESRETNSPQVRSKKKSEQSGLLQRENNAEREKEMAKKGNKQEKRTQR